MKVILHMSISIDCYVAKSDGDSDWVSQIDEKLFLKRCIESGCVIIGRNTYDKYKGDIYPIKDIISIVLTKRPLRDKGILTAKSPKEAIEIVAKKGFDKVILAGRGLTSTSFLKEGLINEIFLTLHPLLLGKGIRLFDQLNSEFNFQLIDTKELGEGLVQLHYKIR